MGLHPTIMARMKGYETLAEWVAGPVRRRQPDAIRAMCVARALSRMDYDDYLRTDQWRTLADAVKRRDKGCCRDCGEAKPDLHAHHLTYATIGRESMDDLRTLCDACHGKRHGVGPSDIFSKAFRELTGQEPLLR